MSDDRADFPQSGRQRRPRKPLTVGEIEDLALAYVARFTTTAQGLRRYLTRKLRERGWADEETQVPTDVAEVLVSRFVSLGYVNDADYARAKTTGLLRRGYGARRVGAALAAAGVDAEDRTAIAEGEARRAALRMAIKRGFGPFSADGMPPTDKAMREKQIAAMLRAGHGMHSARLLVGATDAAAVRAWAAEPDETDG